MRTERLIKLVHAIGNGPGSALLLAGIILATLASGLPQLGSTFTTRGWFQPDDPLVRQLDDFEEAFGNDEAVILAIHNANGVFRPEMVRLVQDLTRGLTQVPGIRRVDSLSNYQHARPVGDDVVIAPFLPEEAGLSAARLEAMRHTALQHSVIPGYLLDRSAELTLIYGRLRSSLSHTPDYTALLGGVQKLLRETPLPEGTEIRISGAAALNNAFQVAAEKDMQVTMPFLMLAIVLLLIVVYRRFSLVALPLTLILATQLAVFGFCGWMGIRVDTVIAILPMIIIAICMADAIHLQTSLVAAQRRGLNGSAALQQAATRVMLPTILTTVTTVTGFLSLTLTTLRPIHNLGIAAAMACGLAWLFTWFLIFPLLSLLARRGRLPQPAARSGNGFDRCAGFIMTHRRTLLLSGMALVTTCVTLLPRLTIDSEPNAYFTREVPIRKANDLIYERLGGFNGPEIIIDSGREDGILEPDFLRRIAALEDWIMATWPVNQTVSVADSVRIINRLLHEGREDQYRIPDSPQEVAQELLFYSMGMSEGRGLRQQVSTDYRLARVAVLWSLTRAGETLTAVDRINGKMQELGLNGYVTGKYFLLYRLNQRVVAALMSSVALSFALVSLLLWLVFGDLKTSLAALAANAIPVLVGAASIILMGKSVNVGTAMVVSICLGIAVDDTIHMISAWHEHGGQKPQKRLGLILGETGGALGITTLILVMSFGSFMLGDFVPNVELGLFCCIVLTTALVTDIFWLPCLLQFVEAPLSKNQTGTVPAGTLTPAAPDESGSLALTRGSNP